MPMPSKRIPSALIGLAFAAHATSAAATLDVFACEPEWGALIRILAPTARITNATHAYQDPHHIEARPSLIAGLRRADLAVCTGAALEDGWLPTLQQRAANADVRNGRAGMFFATEHVILLRDPDHDHPDRRMGDIHAEGNPHFHLDPYRLREVGKALAHRLAAIDPPNADAYHRRYRAWSGEWQDHIKRWEAVARSLTGRAVVAQHGTFAYLWRWLGIQQIADLEPKPGLPPTARHLRQVLAQVRDGSPVAVVQTLYQDPHPGEWLVGRIRSPLLTLPSTVTREGRSSDLVGLFDTLLARLGEARRAVDG